MSCVNRERTLFQNNQIDLSNRSESQFKQGVSKSPSDMKELM